MQLCIPPDPSNQPSFYNTDIESFNHSNHGKKISNCNNHLDIFQIYENSLKHAKYET